MSLGLRVSTRMGSLTLKMEGGPVRNTYKKKHQSSKVKKGLIGTTKDGVKYAYAPGFISYEYLKSKEG